MLSHSRQACFLIGVKIYETAAEGKKKKVELCRGWSCVRRNFGKTVHATSTVYQHSAPREEPSFKDRADLFGWASFQ